MTGSDRDLINWDKRLKQQVLRGWDNYKRFRYDLTTPRGNDYLGLTGEFLFIENASSKSAFASIRLNRNTNDPIDLEVGTILKTIFEELYVTNTAQPGEWFDIIVGINFEYYKQQALIKSEAQACIMITNALPNVNTLGAAFPCNRVLVRALTGNAGTAWVNFGTPAVANACYELTAGDAISIACSNVNRINALFTVGGDDLTVVPEA